MDDRSKKGVLVPSYEALIAEAAKKDYLRVEDVQKGDTLSVVTLNHQYDFVLLDPARRHIRMTSDHPEFRGPHDGYLLGSLLVQWGSSLMVGRVALGLSLAFSSPDFIGRFAPPEIRTSLVQEVLLNGHRILPAVQA